MGLDSPLCVGRGLHGCPETAGRPLPPVGRPAERGGGEGPRLIWGKAGTRGSWPRLAVPEAGVRKDADGETHLWGHPEPSLGPRISGPVCGEPVTPEKALENGTVTS